MFNLVIAIAVGIVTGFIIAIPVGPVGVLVFQRSMLKSRFQGLVTGAGSTIVDGFFAFIGVFGVKVILDFIQSFEIHIKIFGGLIIFGIGIYTVFSKYKPINNKEDTAITTIEHFLSGFILTITNPLTAFSFFLIFASIDKNLNITGYGASICIVLGVMIGAFLWWLTISYLAKKMGSRVRHDHIDIVNKCFGLLMLVIGAVMIIGVYL